MVVAAKKAKKKKAPAKKSAPKVEAKPVPFNELYPDASRIPYVKNFLSKRSK